MTNNIPQGVFQAVARDILGNPNGKFNSFDKEAATREEFLAQYGFTPEQFKNDPQSKEVIDGRLNAAAKQINDFYSAQSKASGGLSPQMKDAQKRGLDALYGERENAIQNRAIDRTIQVADENPDDFQRSHELSNQSTSALKRAYGRETGIGLGGLVGATLGFLAGRKMPKNTKGITQKTLGTTMGALGGAGLGGTIGSHRDEKKTGFNHEDVLQPYEIADRITMRKNNPNG